MITLTEIESRLQWTIPEIEEQEHEDYIDKEIDE